ncbi:hypothetical protein [Pseudomonas sp.]|uniref:hypothetical protein n=1 Tax=Pseudomonas sp. TaxID=306 RepID=UPI003FD7F0F7
MTAYASFAPHQGSNQLVTLVAATPQILTITAQDKSIRIANAGANPVHFRTYDSTITPAPVASSADCPVLAGMASTFTKAMSHDRVAIFSTAGTTVNVCTGEGW